LLASPPQFNVRVDPGMYKVATKIASEVKLSSSYTVPGTNTTFTLPYAPKIKVRVAAARTCVSNEAALLSPTSRPNGNCIAWLRLPWQC
jgi:hypothetical protein